MLLVVRLPLEGRPLCYRGPVGGSFPRLLWWVLRGDLPKRSSLVILLQRMLRFSGRGFTPNVRLYRLVVGLASW